MLPLITSGDWGILLITAAGTVLATTAGHLPQWEKEKWACRKRASPPYILTRGNGAQHAVAILGNCEGLNLEDMASGYLETETTLRARTNLWYLLIVGVLGICQNVLAAGLARTQEPLGMPLDIEKAYGGKSVMGTLRAVEEEYRGVGHSMLGVFFPNGINSVEEEQWEKIEREREERERGGWPKERRRRSKGPQTEETWEKKKYT
ncbi:uncharacterized protein BO97DRAFT_447303 [Aspergillus homomorphus CBS 101889]|uniref:Uncharacterized protein n=1 Tax=Aspergillus homomorphus (strain CBS 101889) TaxID=1450537 RepID=A0A395HKM6_ASPHC|nr:hypothetical protein BO97DRAFT_447303 [Aspergillus homomorphus CBS 101889]RAL06814.1 hypothetical protein BO97DRAFT_447303 [Aspergillus homomorphus CBS 101889]